MVRAYLREFRADDPVSLVILTQNYHAQSADPPWRQMEVLVKAELEQSGRDESDLPRIHVSDRYLPAVRPFTHLILKVSLRVIPLTSLSPPPPSPSSHVALQSDLPSLYRSASAFVLPSHGEGWGRPHVEAMSMGLPLIATNWSGPTAFMTEMNSYPLAIEPELVPVGSGEKHDSELSLSASVSSSQPSRPKFTQLNSAQLIPAHLNSAQNSVSSFQLHSHSS